MNGMTGWRQVYQLMADGATLKAALKQMKENQLFWTREVYERIMFQQLRTPRDPKGKGKGKGRGKTKTGKGVYPDHLKLGAPIPNGSSVLPGKHSCPGIATDPMLALSGSTGGPAMGITPQTSAPTKANLEPSRDLELTAHTDRRAGRRILRMKSHPRLRQTGSKDRRRLLCLQKSDSFP